MTSPRSPRFHGRVPREEPCAVPGCAEAGEFRAPAERAEDGGEGPRPWRWLCLDHVREFNAGYNYFSGMSSAEIEAEQRPFAGWARETRAFAANGSPGPRWADFIDPLDAIGARFGRKAEPQRADGRPLSGADRKALATLGLGADADRRALRRRYADLLHRYHPDRNGGDRSHEKALQEVIAAYAQLKSAPAFA
ncbi:MAG: molecular chaperone DnaJ [Sphingomonas sp. SCN 67-18]|uniref:DnaJ domain-containing protein n=1 Tax=uncultured Sphingomonas sp. TaxID=158754 RepID=UPI000869D8E8|nr:DnaJ domain-containing protein [Sphingomonas sp. SCN 67-18]ODU21119.1 MAG: molecular chaperone DnaJ [Sphingomonas sp. SCN 67-18]